MISFRDWCQVSNGNKIKANHIQTEWNLFFWTLKLNDWLLKPQCGINTINTFLCFRLLTLICIQYSILNLRYKIRKKMNVERQFEITIWLLMWFQSNVSNPWIFQCTFQKANKIISIRITHKQYWKLSWIIKQQK